MPGVIFRINDDANCIGLGTACWNIQFNSTKYLNQMILGTKELTIDGISFGGYKTGGTFGYALNVYVLAWTMTPGSSGYWHIMVRVAADSGTMVHFNVSGPSYKQTLAALIDGSRATSSLYHYSGTSVMLNWSSWSTYHTFEWLFNATINNQEIIPFLTNFLLIFGFVTIVTLALVGAYRLRQRRGGV
jgi:hypothetical protein